MGAVLTSYDTLLASASDNGLWPVFYAANVGTTTAANSTSGLISSQRFPRTITVPSLGAGLTGVVFPTVNMIVCNSSSVVVTDYLCGLETNMGTLTVSGNVFADGATMPTKTVKGASVQTATEYAFLVVTTVLAGATTPVVTITYTNQSGTPSKTATLTLPSNPAVNTAFLINPHLASGDTGIQDITNISISTGTSGVLKVFGVLALSMNFGATTGAGTGPDPYTVPNIPWTAAAADTIAFYSMGSTGSEDMYTHLVGIADN